MKLARRCMLVEFLVQHLVLNERVRLIDSMKQLGERSGTPCEEPIAQPARFL